MAFDRDGERLLFITDICTMTGWKETTVIHYNTQAARARDHGMASEKDMPKPVDKVRRRMTKGNGKPLIVNTPVWRDVEVRAWLTARGVKLVE
jgi:hypothetical protein